MLAVSENRGRLLRVLGIVFGFAAVVGGMVGQGILRTPGLVAGAVYSPQLMLFLWLCGAILVAISAFAYVELGTAIPCAGGPYDYVRRAFGQVPGAIAGWAGWLILVSAAAFQATVVAEFLHRLGVWPGVSTPFLGIALIVICWAVNWTSTRISGDSQILFSATKGVALIGLVILLLAHSGSPAAAPPPISGAIGIAGVAVAMRVIVNTYDGWQDTVYHCEELERPARTLPRSMALGILGVAILYLLVNLALLHVLSPAQMAMSNLPAANAAQLVLGPAGEVALTLFGILSIAAITNLNVMRSARVAFAMGRERHLPARLSHVASSGTPREALASSALLALIFAGTGTYQTLIAMNVALTVSLVVVVNVSAIELRRKEPALPRPFRIPLYPIPVVLAIGINLALLAALIFEDPLHSLEGYALLAVIGVVYWLIISTRQRSPSPAA